MHETDDGGTNELSSIFVTWFYNFKAKYCKRLVGQVCVTLWHQGVTGKGSWMQVLLDILYNHWIYESETFLLKVRIRRTFFS